MRESAVTLGHTARRSGGLRGWPPCVQRRDRRRLLRRRGDGGDRGRARGGARRPAPPPPSQHADRARRRDLRREQVVRPLLRDLSERGQPGRPAALHRRAGTPAVNGLDPTLLTQQPELVNPQRLDRSEAVTCDQNHDYARRAGGVQPRRDGQVRPEHDRRPCGTRRTKSIVMGYYDGNTVTGAVEPRPALRDERQLLRHEVRAVDDRRDQPDQRPDTTAPTADRHAASRTARSQQPRARARRLREPGRRHALRQEHRRPDERRGRHLGLVPGRLHADRRSTARATAVCNTAHPNVGGANVSDYVPHHNPFAYYARTANIHHLPPTSHGDDRHAPTRPTTSTT